jgi:hypothetical protein
VIEDYLLIGLMIGFYYLGAFLVGKADQRKYQKEMEKEYARRYIAEHSVKDL